MLSSQIRLLNSTSRLLICHQPSRLVVPMMVRPRLGLLAAPKVACQCRAMDSHATASMPSTSSGKGGFESC